MTEILKAAIEALRRGESVALATIVAASGSLPMSRRSKLLVLADGTLLGTVGGGCLEAEIFARGAEALRREGPPALARFVLTEKQAGAEGLNCGGTVEILIEVLRPGSVEEVLRAAVAAIERREEAVLVTSLAAGPGGQVLKTLIGHDVSTGSLGSAHADEAASTRAKALLGRDAIGVEEVGLAGRLFLESIEVVPTAILFGGGHVGREVARVARAAGFRVVVVDDRAWFASRERHPEADETRVLPFTDCVSALTVDRHTYLVVVTRGHQHDETVVRQALRTGAAYVGMIGSGRKVALARKRLAAEGFTKAELDRLHAPVGLEIGADTPGEIAVSVVAEMIAVRRRGGSPASMSLSGRLRT